MRRILWHENKPFVSGLHLHKHAYKVNLVHKRAPLETLVPLAKSSDFPDSPTGRAAHYKGHTWKSSRPRA